MSLWDFIKSVFDHNPFPVVSPKVQPLPTDNFSDIEIVARTLYGEARGESTDGKIGIANVIIRRSKVGGWWGSNLRAVCLAKEQFSCWNPSDPNRKVLLGQIDDSAYKECLSIALRSVAGQITDNTYKADSYCVTGTNPYWAKNISPCAVIGKHSFYRTITS